MEILEVIVLEFSVQFPSHLKKEMVHMEKQLKEASLYVEAS